VKISSQGLVLRGRLRGDLSASEGNAIPKKEDDVVSFRGFDTTVLAILGAAMTVAAAGSAISQARRAPAQEAPRRELWLFFTPDAARLAPDVRGLGEVLGRHPDLSLRPTLLSESTAFLKAPTADLADTVKALSGLPGPGLSIRLWDDEGLARARELGIDRFPAWALVDPPDRTGLRRARVAFGFGVKLEELLR
jgi:hypothetical protein